MQEVNQNSINILIVEDERIPATYLKNIIEEDSDFKVIGITTSADETLASIKRQKPHIIFMDIMIKGSLSGAELALKIHTLYENIKIIFLTAFSDDEMVEYATDAKAVAYLLKPYRPKEIKATLALLKPSFRNIESATKQKDKVVLKDGFVYNLKDKLLLKNNEAIKLTPKETELLDILCHNTERTLAKEVIIENMNISDASLRAIIYRLRKHLNSDIIASSKKFGYKILTEE